MSAVGVMFNGKFPQGPTTKKKTAWEFGVVGFLCEMELGARANCSGALTPIPAAACEGLSLKCDKGQMQVGHVKIGENCLLSTVTGDGRTFGVVFQTCGYATVRTILLQTQGACGKKLSCDHHSVNQCHNHLASFSRKSRVS